LPEHLKPLLRRHAVELHTASDRTLFSRMLPRVIGSAGGDRGRLVMLAEDYEWVRRQISATAAINPSPFALAQRIGAIERNASAQ
jgi:hypothetical protein